jgi:hypothetical protein
MKPADATWTPFCGQDRSHLGFRKLPSLTQRYERGEALPLHIVNRIEDRRRDDVTQDLSPEQVRMLAPYQGVRSLTQGQATIILQTIWPKAPAVEVLKAAILCRDYALHPSMKHVFLVPFKKKNRDGAYSTTWAIILGIGATRLMASRRGRYSYVDGPRLMTDEEQMTIRGEVDKERIWAITIVADAAGNRAPGYGNWPKGTEVYGKDKGNSETNMAFLRSERAALDRLRPGELPTGYDVMDAAYAPPVVEEVEGPTELPEPPGVIDVETETGEVRENGDQTLSALADMPNSEVPPLAPAKLTCVNDLTKAAHKRYELQPKQVYAILGVSSAVEIGPDLDAAWAKIVASQEA